MKLLYGTILAISIAHAQPPGEAGLFNREQAELGRTLYASQGCANCHGRELNGESAPALSGPAFARRWTGRPVGDLFTLESTTMPPGKSGSLTTEQHAAIFAYILMRNGYAPGGSPLVPDSQGWRATLMRGDRAAVTGRPAQEFIQGNAKPVAAGAGPTQAELNDAAKSKRDWLYHTHDYAGARYVATDQINTSNIARMQASCVFQIGDNENFQTGPIVYDGVMYLTTPHATLAVDATNCKPKWRYTWQPQAQDVWLTNRGVAIKEGKLVRGTSDGYLIELNASTGELIWARRAANTELGETFTMAPVIFDDLILIGPAGSENGISGWVGAFKFSDGTPVWKFETVPGAHEKGNKSWGNPNNIPLGGGSVWTPFSLDPAAGELFVAVTNPAPDLPGDQRPGDNLYTNSMVVLDVRTGKLKWHRQMVANDSHDYDLTQVSPLYSATVQGHTASMVATVGKDGVMRTVDRNSREVINKTNITTVENNETPVNTKGVHACPGTLGGVEWNGPAYNPATNMLYVGAVDWCATFKEAEEVKRVPGRMYMGGTVQSDKTSQGWITAVDASTGELKWKYRSPRPVVGAVTTTAGGLVFAGELTGEFDAFDARSGNLLYHFNTGGPIGGGIVSYEIGGKQYVAVMSGRPSRFWTDQNPGSATMILFALP
jgi:alcohol dehydrogenase (cytochrome c)